jgi:hypothetical protein
MPLHAEFAMLACLLAGLAVVQAVIVGLGWSTLNSNDVCTGNMERYVFATTVNGTLQLALLGASALLCLLAMCCRFLEEIAFGFGVGVVFLVSVAWSIVNFSLMIWGIIQLANHRCTGTMYFSTAIVFVVLNGIGIFSGLCGSRNNPNNDNW